MVLLVFAGMQDIMPGLLFLCFLENPVGIKINWYIFSRLAYFAIIIMDLSTKVSGQKSYLITIIQRMHLAIYDVHSIENN